ncbi:ketosteroid isomerase-like protein [Paucibacter oligotrophus]|uniref:Ketosteroid isomerase-like protein n=1 Tax=Roseateles oligotrophus TaxID=1769250 RepID=A0A840L310_9BURK|nr:nuclear transport factor 2 family protein [Roseateles oligotrophus]MBB4842620.1 ketosteroid isomerase-like protein [Roseateles oligotrophus]
MNPSQQKVRQYWQAANARDWAAFAELLAEDIVYEVPQTRERVRGRQAYLRFNQTWPGDWEAELLRLLGEGDQAVSEIAFHLRQADSVKTETGISFFEFDAAGRICRIVDHWPAPYEPPPRACDCIERF